MMERNAIKTLELPATQTQDLCVLLPMELILKSWTIVLQMILFPVNKIMVNFVISVEVSYGAIFTAIQIRAWTCTEIINVIIHKQGGHLHMMEIILTNFKLESKVN